MDPLAIVSTLKALINRVQWAFHAIESVEQAEAAEIDALRELETALSVVESDISLFKTTISALQSPENDHFYSAFTQQQGAEEAMVGWNQALCQVIGIFETQQSGLRPVLEPIMHLPHTERPSATPDLKHITRNLLDSLQYAKRAFKRVWYLYTLCHQQHQPIYHSVAMSLNAIQSQFTIHPFAISRPDGSSYAPFSVLNCHQDIEDVEQFSRVLGRDWINRYINSSNAPSELVEAQVSLFGLIWCGTIQRLKANPTHDADDLEYKDFQQTLDQLDRSLQDVIARSMRPRFTISFFGMVKAGKSLFLNAMIGKIVLPSDELPSTAWPCRLVHVKGLDQPVLHVKTEPFDRAVQSFRERGYASKMKNYQAATDSKFDPMADGLGSPFQGASELRNVHHEWMNLHHATRINLLEFEQVDFELPGEASGVEGVRDLLGKINDIVRLCKRFSVRFDGTEDDWPVLRIEFSSLKDRNSNEVYEFIDLPGIGEQLQNVRASGVQSNWESLVRLAASQSDEIVPIVSVTELPRRDWRDLPKLIESGYDRKPSLAICTHLDRVSRENLRQQLWMVRSVFWPNDHDESRVLKCSSLMGLSANKLLEQSETTKPPFEDIWDPNSIGYHCALKILGEGEPEWVYQTFNPRTWRMKIQQQLDASELPYVMHKLTGEMVDNTREKALNSETEDAIRLIQELRKRVGRRLLEARRTWAEFATAEQEYKRIRENVRTILESWDQGEERQINTSRVQLRNAYNFVSHKAERLIQSALHSALKYCEETFEGPNLTMINRAMRHIESDGLLDAEITDEVLEVKSFVHAEEFLRWSQSLLHKELRTVGAEYVDAVRRLGEEAKSSRIDALRTALQSLGDLQTELLDNVMADLQSQSINIRELAYNQIRRNIKVSSTRYTAKTAFQTIEAKLARWWLNPTPDDEQVPGRKYSSSPTDKNSRRTVGSPPTYSPLRTDDDRVEKAARHSIEQLGFMLRAPLTVATSIAWTVSAPIWVFIPESHTYHLPMKAIKEQYNQMIVHPWLESLNKEGEESLLGIIGLSSRAAKDILNGALEREESRFTREWQTKNQPLDDRIVDNLVTAFVNLLAAEAALHELKWRIGQK